MERLNEKGNTSKVLHRKMEKMIQREECPKGRVYVSVICKCDGSNKKKLVNWDLRRQFL